MNFIFIFLTAFVLALIFTPVAIWLAPKIGAVDIPKDARRMHTKPMPRFGGMAIFIGATIAITVFIGNDPRAIGILIGGVCIYALGVVDDLKGMPAKVKLLGQIGCASIVFAFGIRIQFITNHFGDGHSYLVGITSFIITIIWIVGITNTVNLIDGLDGLAAGVAAIASLSICYTAYIHGMYEVTFAMLAIAGGALGFLPFNFHPAKIFMGDGGSLFLGFMLAAFSIMGPVKGATIVATIVPVLVLGIPIFDTAFAILRRLINRRPIMEADKGHLHHRMMAVGLGQKRTVLMIYGISAVMGIAAVLFSRDLFVETIGLIVAASTFIYIYITDSSTQRLGIEAIDIAAEEEE
ncbi:MAG TPA: MraY family glycosyltransferase [Anaerovoracaceae bacterium]|nr:MraY family glycosyltransferase [Anaerovoracaceae bacterium]